MISFEELKKVVIGAPAMWCSPYCTKPCSDECPVCNMNKDLYNTVKESIEKDARYQQYLILREEFENDNGRVAPNKEGL